MAGQPLGQGRSQAFIRHLFVRPGCGQAGGERGRKERLRLGEGGETALPPFFFYFFLRLESQRSAFARRDVSPVSRYKRSSASAPRGSPSCKYICAISTSARGTSFAPIRKWRAASGAFSSLPGF